MSILWGQKEQEQLTATTSDEAIEEFLDGCGADLPDQATVYEYKQLEVSVDGLAEMILEVALEWLDENFGDPDEYSKATSEMAAASRRFAQTMTDHYHVWRHEQTGHQVTVDVPAWIKEHRPDWLEPRFVGGKVYRAANVSRADIGKQDYHCTVVKRADGRVEVLDESIIDHEDN